MRCRALLLVVAGCLLLQESLGAVSVSRHLLRPQREGGEGGRAGLGSALPPRSSRRRKKSKERRERNALASFPVIFASVCFKGAFQSYGWMAVESAFRMYPNLQRYIIITDKSSTAFKRVLSNSTAKRVKVLQLLDDTYLHPVNKAGYRQPKKDSNYAQIAAIGKTLRYVQQQNKQQAMYSTSPSRGVHLVFQDLDVLPLSSHWLEQVFGPRARPFTMAVVTRPTNIYAALNCGLLLFHRARLQQAEAFFALALDLYRGHNYFSLARLVHGNSCCAQHVLQHGLELVLGGGAGGVEGQQWQRYSSRLIYHSRQARQQQQHQQQQLTNNSVAPGTVGIVTGSSVHLSSPRLSSFPYQNTSCVDAFPGLTLPASSSDTSASSSDALTDFVLLSLPLRKFLPSSTSYRPLPASLGHAKMMHYKGGGKQAHMARDYRASLLFDFSRRGDEERFRLLIGQTYSPSANNSNSSRTTACVSSMATSSLGAGAGASASSTTCDCLLPCCDAGETCQQPTLRTALAQCHRQLFKYRDIEQYYIQRKKEQQISHATM